MRGRYPGRPRRLGAYDYAQDGAYSVTISTKRQARLFGTVTDGQMTLNAAGRAVEEVWHGLPSHYPHVELDVFVVMPDHVHGIVVFSGGEEEAGYKPAGTKDRGPANKEGLRRRHGLSEVIRGFKTYSGRRVNEVRGTPGRAVWRRGYYEHVVRNEEDMNRIRQYFQENPLRWSLKRENEGVWGRRTGESG